MKTVDIQISKLKLAEYNPRKISDKELSNLNKSLEKFGFVQPVIINKDFTVVSGHQRIRAWKELKNETVPTVQVDITKKEEKALNLAMNRISGEWDMEKLYGVMNDLRVTDELEFTGFDEKEVSKILDQFLEDDVEDSTEKLLERLPAKAKKGEIYELGNHRLMCGDSTSLDDVMNLTEAKKMDMVWTDPPYNVNYKSSDQKLGSIENDNMSDASFTQFSRDVFQNLMAVTKQGGGLLCLHWLAVVRHLSGNTQRGRSPSERSDYMGQEYGRHSYARIST